VEQSPEGEGALGPVSDPVWLQVASVSCHRQGSLVLGFGRGSAGRVGVRRLRSLKSSGGACGGRFRPFAVRVRRGSGSFKRQEGRKRRRRRRTAARKEQSSEGRNPMSGCGMKQGHQARGGSRRQEVEKTWRRRRFGEASRANQKTAASCGETLKGQETSREDVGEANVFFGAQAGHRRLEAWRTLKEGARP
jgi:hypothetical protein